MSVYDPTEPNDFQIYYHIHREKRIEKRSALFEKGIHNLKAAKRRREEIESAQRLQPQRNAPFFTGTSAVDPADIMKKLQAALVNIRAPVQLSETADEAYTRRKNLASLVKEKPKFKILIEGLPLKSNNAEDLSELKTDMVRQCNRYGVVTHYELSANDTELSILITFKTEEQAQRACKKLDGRNFDGSLIYCNLI